MQKYSTLWYKVSAEGFEKGTWSRKGRELTRSIISASVHQLQLARRSGHQNSTWCIKSVRFTVVHFLSVTPTEVRPLETPCGVRTARWQPRRRRTVINAFFFILLNAPCPFPTTSVGSYAAYTGYLCLCPSGFKSDIQALILFDITSDLWFLRLGEKDERYFARTWKATKEKGLLPPSNGK